MSDDGFSPPAESPVDSSISDTHETAAPAATELIERTAWLIKLRWIAIVGVLLVLEIVRWGFEVPKALPQLRLVMVFLACYNLLLAVVVPRWRWRAGEGELPDHRLANIPLILTLAPVFILRALFTVTRWFRQAVAHSLLTATDQGRASRASALTRLLVPRAWWGLRREREIYQAAVLASAQMIVDVTALAALIHFAGGIENPFIFFFVFHVIISAILLSTWATFVNTTYAVFLACGIGLGELFGLLAHYPLDTLARHGEYQNPTFVAAQLLVLSTTLCLAAYMASSIVAHLREYEREAVSLSRELTVRAEELQAANMRLSQVEQAKSLYMRKVAHELKAPLATIQAMLKVVLDGLAGEIAEKAREIVARADLRAGELAQATHDLLTLARAREGHLATEMLPLDVGEVAAEVVADLRPSAEQVAVTLSLEGNNSAQRMIAEPNAIRQLIRNLVSNAIRYNRPGGTVRVRVAEVDPDSIQIEVEDSGIGIPSRDLPRIFDEFFRSDTAKRHVAAGTGLGLSIVRAVSEQHGGRVTVRSTPGEGSCFTVRLPRTQQAAES